MSELGWAEGYAICIGILVLICLAAILLFYIVLKREIKREVEKDVEP
ncbi:MAG: hypothetical protein JSV85_07880 [Candidatus Bathyarchaeota archaeon]|nr:MAG: hypothetical protein JSV85_07880 [Candidatus Bathyarchaeota archaeon]